jgi:hypothetical protein
VTGETNKREGRFQAFAPDVDAASSIARRFRRLQSGTGRHSWQREAGR